MTDAERRLQQKLTAALHSPNFAVRWLADAPAAARTEVLRRWSQEPAPSAPAEPRPGLRKCGSASSANQGQELAAQLAAFARTVRRLG